MPFKYSHDEKESSRELSTQRKFKCTRNIFSRDLDPKRPL